MLGESRSSWEGKGYGSPELFSAGGNGEQLGDRDVQSSNDEEGRVPAGGETSFQPKVSFTCRLIGTFLLYLPFAASGASTRFPIDFINPRCETRSGRRASRRKGIYITHDQKTKS